MSLVLVRRSQKVTLKLNLKVLSRKTCQTTLKVKLMLNHFKRVRKNWQINNKWTKKWAKSMTKIMIFKHSKSKSMNSKNSKKNFWWMQKWTRRCKLITKMMICQKHPSIRDKSHQIKNSLMMISFKIILRKKFKVIIVSKIWRSKYNLCRNLSLYLILNRNRRSSRMK